MGLFTPKYTDKNESRAIKGIKLIENKEELFKAIVASQGRTAVALAGLEKLPSDRYYLIAGIYTCTGNYELRRRALDRLLASDTPAQCYFEIIRMCSFEEHVTKAFERLETLDATEEMYFEIAQNCIFRDVAWKAFEHLSSPAFFEKLAARPTADPEVRTQALEKVLKDCDENTLKRYINDAEKDKVLQESFIDCLSFTSMKATAERVARYLVANGKYTLALLPPTLKAMEKTAAAALADEMILSGEYKPACMIFDYCIDLPSTQGLKKALAAVDNHFNDGREDAIPELVRRGEITSDELAAYLDCGHYFIQKTAAELLVKQGDRRAIPFCADNALIEWLVQLPCEESVDALVGLLEKQPWLAAKAIKQLYAYPELWDYIRAKPLEKYERKHWDIGDRGRSCHDDEPEINFEFLH